MSDHDQQPVSGSGGGTSNAKATEAVSAAKQPAGITTAEAATSTPAAGTFLDRRHTAGDIAAVYEYTRLQPNVVRRQVLCSLSFEKKQQLYERLCMLGVQPTAHEFSCASGRVVADDKEFLQGALLAFAGLEYAVAETQTSSAGAVGKEKDGKSSGSSTSTTKMGTKMKRNKAAPGMLVGDNEGSGGSSAAVVKLEDAKPAFATMTQRTDAAFPRLWRKIVKKCTRTRSEEAGGSSPAGAAAAAQMMSPRLLALGSSSSSFGRLKRQRSVSSDAESELSAAAVSIGGASGDAGTGLAGAAPVLAAAAKQRSSKRAKKLDADTSALSVNNSVSDHEQAPAGDVLADDNKKLPPRIHSIPSGRSDHGDMTMSGVADQDQEHSTISLSTAGAGAPLPPPDEATIRGNYLSLFYKRNALQELMPHGIQCPPDHHTFETFWYRVVGTDSLGATHYGPKRYCLDDVFCDLLFVQLARLQSKQKPELSELIKEEISARKTPVNLLKVVTPPTTGGGTGGSGSTSSGVVLGGRGNVVDEGGFDYIGGLAGSRAAVGGGAASTSASKNGVETMRARERRDLPHVSIAHVRFRSDEDLSAKNDQLKWSALQRKNVASKEQAHEHARPDNSFVMLGPPSFLANLGGQRYLTLSGLKHPDISLVVGLAPAAPPAVHLSSGGPPPPTSTTTSVSSSGRPRGEHQEDAAWVGMTAAQLRVLIDGITDVLDCCAPFRKMVHPKKAFLMVTKRMVSPDLPCNYTSFREIYEAMRRFHPRWKRSHAELIAPDAGSTTASEDEAAAKNSEVRASTLSAAKPPASPKPKSRSASSGTTKMTHAATSTETGGPTSTGAPAGATSNASTDDAEFSRRPPGVIADLQQSSHGSHLLFGRARDDVRTFRNIVIPIGETQPQLDALRELCKNHASANKSKSVVTSTAPRENKNGPSSSTSASSRAAARQRKEKQRLRQLRSARTVFIWNFLPHADGGLSESGWRKILQQAGPVHRLKMNSNPSRNSAYLHCEFSQRSHAENRERPDGNRGSGKYCPPVPAPGDLVHAEKCLHLFQHRAISTVNGNGLKMILLDAQGALEELWVREIQRVLKEFGEIKNRKVYHVKEMFEKTVKMPLDFRAAGFANVEDCLRSVPGVKLECEGPLTYKGRRIKSLRYEAKAALGSAAGTGKMKTG